MYTPFHKPQESNILGYCQVPSVKKVYYSINVGLFLSPSCYLSCMLMALLLIIESFTQN